MIGMVIGKRRSPLQQAVDEVLLPIVYSNDMVIRNDVKPLRLKELSKNAGDGKGEQQ